MAVKESAVIDYKKFGMILKGVRIASGYEKCEDLIADVNAKTGLSLSAKTLYRVEHGERALSLEAYLAFQQVMPRFFNADMFEPALKFNRPEN